MVPLLDVDGEWTHRDRHQHHRFDIQVPERTLELRVRLRFGPLDMGSEHEQNQLAMSLFGPDGFRGAAAVLSRGDQQITISESASSLGAVAGPIRAGSWSINVDAGEILSDGAETGVLTYHLEAIATTGRALAGEEPVAGSVGSASPAAVEPRATDGARWFRGDLHSHTVHSDGTITVEDRVRGAVERGMDFLAITDHNTVSHHRELIRWPETITPIRGSEVTTFHGHMNCWGLGDAIDWRNDDRGRGAADIVEQAHRQDALVSINHPNAFGDPWCTGCHWDFALVDFASFDAIEVWNGRWAIPETDNLGALAFWTELLDAGIRLTAVSGTDSHSAEEDAYVGLAMNYVHAPDRAEASILDGIRRGRVVLSLGPMLTFEACGADGSVARFPGDEMPAAESVDLTVSVDRLDVSATLWFATSGSRVELGRCAAGSTQRRDEGLVANDWWRLELRDGPAVNGDLLALTNPVYMSQGS